MVADDGHRKEPNLSLTAAARRLGVSPHTLRAWARYQRRLPYFRLGRRLLLIPETLRRSRQGVGLKPASSGSDDNLR